MEPLYSHSKFEVLIIVIFKNTYDDVWFRLSYDTQHKINMIRIRTLKYSLKRCAFVLLAALFDLLMSPFNFFANATNTRTTKTEDFDV